MKRLLIGIGLLGVILFLAACSKDKKTNPNLTPGDPSNAQYIDARSATNALVERISTMAADAYGYINFDGGYPKTLSDSSSVTYNENGSWWVVYNHHDGNGYNSTIYDSLRFENGSVYTQYPDSQLTSGIDYRSGFLSGSVQDSVNTDIDYALRYYIAGFRSPQITYNGTMNMTIQVAHGSSSNLAETFGTTITALTFNSSDLPGGPSYPISGQSAIALALNSTGQGGSGSSNWNITATYFPDHVHYYFVSVNNYWEWDYSYGR